MFWSHESALVFVYEVTASLWTNECINSSPIRLSILIGALFLQMHHHVNVPCDFISQKCFFGKPHSSFLMPKKGFSLAQLLNLALNDNTISNN